MPCATAMMHTPLPAESASHISSGTRTICGRASRASRSGGSSFHAPRLESARVAWRSARSPRSSETAARSPRPAYRAPPGTRSPARRRTGPRRTGGRPGRSPWPGHRGHGHPGEGLCHGHADAVPGCGPRGWPPRTPSGATENAARVVKADPADGVSGAGAAQSQMGGAFQPAQGSRGALQQRGQRHRTALSCQKAISPLPPARGPISASARVKASAGASHPATTSHPKVDGTAADTERVEHVDRAEAPSGPGGG